MKVLLIILFISFSTGCFAQDSSITVRLNERAISFIARVMDLGKEHLFDDNSLGAKTASDIYGFSDSLKAVFINQYKKWYPAPKTDSTGKK